MFPKSFIHISKIIAIAILGGCTTGDELRKLAQSPKLTPIPRDVINAHQESSHKTSSLNSLWEQSDHLVDIQRARQIGDSLTIEININREQANLSGSVTKTRSAESQFAFGMPLVGLQTKPLWHIKSQPNRYTSTGNTTRGETVKIDIPATIMYKTMRGSLIVSGRQEILVNKEIRVIEVAGIVRPQDIGADNRVDHSKVAELRVAYYGKMGLSSDNPPIWYQVLQALQIT